MMRTTSAVLTCLYVWFEASFLIVTLGLLAMGSIDSHRVAIDRASTTLIAAGIWLWFVWPVAARVASPSGWRWPALLLVGAAVALPAASTLKTGLIDGLAERASSGSRLLHAVLAGFQDSESRQQVRVLGMTYPLSGGAPFKSAVERVLLPLLLDRAVSASAVEGQLVDGIIARIQDPCLPEQASEDCSCGQLRREVWRIGETVVQSYPSARALQYCVATPLVDSLETRHRQLRESAAAVADLCTRNAAPLAQAGIDQRLQRMDPAQRELAIRLLTDEDEEAALAEARRALAEQCAQARDAWRTRTLAQVGEALPLAFSRATFETSPKVNMLVETELARLAPDGKWERPERCATGVPLLRADFERCVHRPLISAYVSKVREKLHLTDRDFDRDGRLFEYGDAALRRSLSLAVGVMLSSIGVALGVVRLLVVGGSALVGMCRSEASTGRRFAGLGAAAAAAVATFGLLAGLLATEPPEPEAIRSSVAYRAVREIDVVSTSAATANLLRLVAWWAFVTTSLIDGIDGEA